MPISAPSQIGLDVTRPPALPDIAAARADIARRSEASAAAFRVGGKEPEAPTEAGKTAAPESFKRFEAMVLQTFIQNMLPKDGAAVYGKGMAGEMWKSMLAEKVAGVVAERGGIGIADRMLGARYADEAKPVAQTAPASPAAAVDAQETDSQFLIAPTVLDGMQRSLSELLTDAATAKDKIQSING